MLSHDNSTTAQPSSPKISVNVPVYNTEKYLRACLDSLVAQTFEDFEVVCIDDGSTDMSVEIIQEFANRDKRFRLLKNKEGKGASTTRNTGIIASSGEYIVSVDSDDFTTPDMLEKFWNASRDGYYDVICAGSLEFISDGGITSTHIPNDVEVEFNSFELGLMRNTIPVFWAKMIRKSLYTDNNIFCPKQKLYEDLGTIPRLLNAAKNYRSISDILYYYRGLRKESLINSVTGKHITHYADIYRILFEYFEGRISNAEEMAHIAADIIQQLNLDMAFISKKFTASNFEDSDILEYLKQLLLLKVSFLQLRSDLKNLDNDELLHRIKVNRFM
jgi:glycosyltransferase involved in cell wall biosynthesis